MAEPNQSKEAGPERGSKSGGLKKIMIAIFILSLAGGIIIMFAEYVLFEYFWQ